MLSDMASCTLEKLISILEFTLSRLARYDEGNPIGALLSMAPKPNSIFNKMKNFVGDQGILNSASGTTSPHSNHSNSQPSKNSGIVQQQGQQGAGSSHLGQSYVAFMRGSSEQLQQVIIDEVWVNRLFEVFFNLNIAGKYLC